MCCCILFLLSLLATACQSQAVDITYDDPENLVSEYLLEQEISVDVVANHLEEYDIPESVVSDYVVEYEPFEPLLPAPMPHNFIVANAHYAVVILPDRGIWALGAQSGWSTW